MGSGQCTAVIGEETAAAGRDQRHLRQAGGPAGGETGGAGGAGAGTGQGKLDRLESQQAGLQTDLAHLTSACDLVERVLEGGSAAQLLLVRKQVVEEINDKLEELRYERAEFLGDDPTDGTE